VKEKEPKNSADFVSMLDGVLITSKDFIVDVQAADRKLIKEIVDLLNKRQADGDLEFTYETSSGMAVGALVGVAIGACVVGGAALTVGCTVTVTIAGVACPIVLLAIVGGCIIGAIIGGYVGHSSSRKMRLSITDTPNQGLRMVGKAEIAAPLA